MYMLILNFTYPLRCLRVPLGVRVPPVEYHCIKVYMVLDHTNTGISGSNPAWELDVSPSFCCVSCVDSRFATNHSLV